jgi:predicted TIM-barrel fold metal-dependent hydrolase
MAVPHRPSPVAVAEAALEPQRPILDAHHHLWERAGERYLLAELLEDVSCGHNIVATVAVECRAMYRNQGVEELKPLGETEFLASIADPVGGAPAVAAAIVGFADLRLGNRVAVVLEGHLAAGAGRFRGIRHSTTWDASDALRSDAPRGLMSEGSFRRGFACLRAYGLTFDAWLYHPQLAELAKLAAAFPDVSIVLNHLGGPLGIGPYTGKRTEVFQSWRQGILSVAACANVSVKLGGLGSERSGFDWHEGTAKLSSNELAAAIRPYIELCVEAFGVARCMFESNFPVEKRANSYAVLWNAFKRVTAGCSESERAALFHDTAARIYRVTARNTA